MWSRSWRGDTITATYVDTDDGQGGNAVLTRDVAVDCTAPIFNDITLLEARGFDATLAVTLNEPANLTIRYGTSCGNLNGAVGSSRSASHEVRISGLSPETTYFYALDAEGRGRQHPGPTATSASAIRSRRPRPRTTTRNVSGIRWTSTAVS